MGGCAEQIGYSGQALKLGINIPSSCLLCNGSDDARQHLFFDCSFSHAIWSSFTQPAQLHPPTDFQAAQLWLKSASLDKNITVILKLIFQASIYVIWRERNARIHTTTSTPASVIIKDIHRTICARLDLLSK